VIWLAGALVAAAALLGAPLFAVVFAAAMVGFAASGIDLTVVAGEVYRLVDTPFLVALPLFTFAGYVLAEARTSHRLVQLVQSLFGWMPSGFASVRLVTCAFFTALTGASGVTIVALGALLLPALKSSGYAERYSLGLVTSSGSLGLLLVPSVPLILYGVIANQQPAGRFELADLFVAGLLPALLMVVMLSAYTLWHTRHSPPPRHPFELVRVKEALVAARWELPLPFVVLGGIYGGVFAVSEAAAVTALYVTIAEVLLYREVTFKRLSALIVDSMVMVGGILLIVGAAFALTNYLIDAEVPQRLFDLLREHVQSRVAFLILLNVLLLVIAAVLDVFAALVIMVPLIVPAAVQFGVHPVHLGIIFLANLQIGYFTPPMGLSLFIASYRFGRPITELYAACLPFMWVLIVALLLITYVPGLSLAFVGD
jgi:C4-dicarboxylate transporter, DctM subunit